MSELLNILEFTAGEARRLAAEQSVTEAPIVIDGVTVIPVSKLSCGFSGGGSNTHKDDMRAGAGAHVKKTPVTFLTVSGTDVQLLRVEQDDAKKGLVDALKPLISKLRKKKSDADADAES